MTTEELEKILGLLTTVDGGCPTCVVHVTAKLFHAFPEMWDRGQVHRVWGEWDFPYLGDEPERLEHLRDLEMLLGESEDEDEHTRL